MPFSTARRAPAAPLAGALPLLFALFPHAAAAQSSIALRSERIATGIPQPTWVGAPNQDYNRLFVLEKGVNGTANIRVIDLRTNTLQPTPYLTITGLQTTGEAGLVGMAFHPDFANNGYFWIHCVKDAHVRIIRYRALGDPLTSPTADPASETPVLSIPGHPPTSVHHAGWMQFDPSGALQIAVGDGGQGYRAQIISGELSGKILRIDVDGPDNIPGNEDDDGFPDDPTRLYTIPPDNPFVGRPGDDEIWSYGFRNPWRNDIDPATGNIFLANVGDGAWEEINFEPATPPGTLPGQPGYHGGRNYGWPCYEGNAEYALDGCPDPSELTFPFLVYGHNEVVPPLNVTGCSVTGGVVYRGCAIPELQGAYFFADLCRGYIYSLRYDGTTITDLTPRHAELDPPGVADIAYISSFGRDAWGEIYICDLPGWEIFKIVPAEPQDVNGDGIPDGCRCPADWDGDGATNSGDISAFLTSWLAALNNGASGGDYNRDGTTNSADISAFLSSWLAALTGTGC